jgi:hypothetical protein
VQSNTALERSRARSCARTKHLRAARSASPLDRTNPFSCSRVSARVLPSMPRRPSVAGACRISLRQKWVGSVGRASPRDQSQVRSWAAAELLQRVKVSAVAPLGLRRHSLDQLRDAPFDPVSRNRAIRQRDKVPIDFSSFGNGIVCDLTPRSSAAVLGHTLGPIVCARRAQLRR